MASRGNRDPGGEGFSLPHAVPLELPHLTRLSWELGSRVTGDDAATRRSRWTHAGSPWSLTVFDVTSETVVLRVRSPAGRERFYGAARMDLRAVMPELESAPRWRRTD